METIWQDVRYALRVMRKSPGFVAAAVLTLALGIGANTAIFSVINAVFLRPLPYHDASHLAWLWEFQPTLAKAPFSGADFLDYQSQNRTFEQLTAARAASFNLTGQGAPERIRGYIASANFFSTLGVSPLAGRAFLPADGNPGAARVAIISYAFWQTHFAGNPAALGQALRLDDQSVQVIGILPADFTFNRESNIFLNPRNVVPEVTSTFNGDARTNRGMHYVSVFGRLKPGVTLAQAESDLAGIAHRLAQQYQSNVGHGVHVVGLRQAFIGDLRLSLLLLLAAVGTVLLIACGNVANLLLARASSRRREVAVRMALGAGRARVARQLFTESLLLAGTGGILGLALAVVCVKLFSAAQLNLFPRTVLVRVDPPVMLFTLAVAILTGILFGLVPALQTSRVPLTESLREGGRGGSSGARSNRVRSALVVAEIAMSLVLLVGAGLLTRSFMRLLAVEPGFNSSNLLTMRLNFTTSRYAKEGQAGQLLEQLIPRVAALPGVESISVANDLPLTGQQTGTGVSQIEGRPALPPGQQILVGVHSINPGYFRFMGAPLLRGREFTREDTAQSRKVIILNQLAAENFWPGQDPIGKHVQVMAHDPEEVVGIAGNILHKGLEEGPSLDTYVPLSQTPFSTFALAVRSRLDATPLVAAIRSEVAKLDPDLPLFDVRPLSQVLAETLQTRQLTLDLLAGFAILALLLAAVGIYGVMSYGVAQRGHEIGIRMALGAERADVLRMVLGQGMRLTAAGIGIGLVASLALTRVLHSLLFTVKSTDPVTFAVVTAALVVVAAAACYLPALRATRVDPIITLRYE